MVWLQTETVSGLTVDMFDRTSVAGATTGLTVLVFLAIGCKKRPQELNSWQLLTLASQHSPIVSAQSVSKWTGPSLMRFYIYNLILNKTEILSVYSRDCWQNITILSNVRSGHTTVLSSRLCSQVIPIKIIIIPPAGSRAVDCLDL